MEQKRAISLNSHSLNLLDECDLAINLTASDFSNIIIPLLSHNINQQKIKHVKKYSITNLKTLTVEQQINITSDFDVSLDTMNASMSGNLNGVISAGFRNDSLILLPAFNSFHLNNLTYKTVNKVERTVIAKLINVITRGFLDQINGYMVSKNPAIPLNFFDDEIKPESFIKDPSAKITLSRPLKITAGLSGFSCIIDKGGIQMLAGFKYSSSPRADVVPVKDKEDFLAFQKDFKDKREKYFTDAPKTSNSYALLLKKGFADFFNASLHNETITIGYKKDNAFSKAAKKHIDIDLNEIDCGKAKLTAPQLHAVPDCSVPNYGGVFGPAKKTAYILNVLPGCLLARGTEVAFNAQAQAAFLAASKAASASCLVAKSSLKVVSNGKISIGDLHYTAALSGAGTASISDISVSEDLTSLSFATQANVSASIQTTFGFTPEGPAGHLLCVLKFDHPYNCNAVAAIASTPVKIGSVYNSSNRESINFKFQSTPLSIPIKVDPTPLTLMNRDIGLLLNCPLIKYGVGLADLGKGFRDVLTDKDFPTDFGSIVVDGKYNYAVDPYNFDIPFNQISLKLSDKKIILNPVNEKLFIGFYK